MAILGTLINQITGGSFAAVAGGAPTTSFATHIHSLPSVPQTVIPVAISVEEVDYLGAPHLLACGQNASVATIGLAMGSGATIPEVAYEATAILWHSKIS